MAKIIATINEKGGVGKTATATTLAYLLSKRGHRTALIDFDGRGFGLAEIVDALAGLAECAERCQCQDKQKG